MSNPRRTSTYSTPSPQETLAVGEAIGRSLVGNLVIGLVGPLGAGKTQLVKGIADGNAADRAHSVSSPTFTLIHEYPGRLTLYHVDAYRLSGPHELAALGFDELVNPQSVVVVEWADRVRAIMPQRALWIVIEATGDQSRRFVLEAEDGPAAECLARFAEARR